MQRIRRINALPAFCLASLIATLAIAANVGGNAAEEQSHQGGAEIIAVKFHADWCGFCKQMGPVFEEMQAKYDQAPVLYITLDQTRESDRRQSQFMAHALRLSEIWGEHGCMTGFILLVDADTRQVVATLKHDMTLKEMGEVLLREVETASGTSQ